VCHRGRNAIYEEGSDGRRKEEVRPLVRVIALALVAGLLEGYLAFKKLHSSFLE